MWRFRGAGTARIAWLIASVLLAACADTSDGPSPQANRQGGGDLEVVKQHGLIVLTMPEPGPRMSVGLGAYKLTTLESGCVVIRHGPRKSDLWPVVWPSGTRIDASGAIRTHFLVNPNPDAFRVGHKVTGGALAIWPAKELKPPKEVAAVCPGSRYLQLEDLEVWRSKSG